MFYFLSKVLGLFINPIFWIIALLLLGLIIKRERLKKRLLISAAALLLFFTNSFILNEIIRPWESFKVCDLTPVKAYTYGIVLSGMTYYDTEHKRVNFLRSSDRIWQALKLYKEGRIEKILITGGPADFFHKDTVESVVLKDFLVSIGIPAYDIITEDKARNTHENALFTKPLVNSNDSLLLITSAMHMRRSYWCFTKVGIICDTYATDFYSGKRSWNIDTLFVPSINALFKWNAFIHELVGLFIYKVSGYV